MQSIISAASFSFFKIFFVGFIFSSETYLKEPRPVIKELHMSLESQAGYCCSGRSVGTAKQLHIGRRETKISLKQK